MQQQQQVLSSEYLVKIEEATPAAGDGRPSAGPVYRSIYAKDGLLEMPTGMDSPWDFFSHSVEKNAKNQMLGRRQASDGKAGPYSWMTYEEVFNATLRIASSIRNRGVNPGDRCGIYGSNCPEWIIAMEACNCQAVTYVPLYDTLGANAVEYIINHAEVSIAFVQESKIPSILKCLPRCTTHLKTIVSFGVFTEEQKKEAEEFGVTGFSWDEFTLLGDQDHEIPPKEKKDICTIMYTSGTTGEPKGVVLNNGAFMAEVLSMDQMLLLTDKVMTGEDTYFSFLPLAHIYDQIMVTYCIYKGSSVGFWQGDVRYLIDDLTELKPTVFSGVPRVYDKIYTGVMQKISAGGTMKKALFHVAYNYKLRNLEKGHKQHEAAPLLDKLVFDKIKQAFGGRVRLMFSGAAPLPKHVEEFLRVTCCTVVAQGYGLTESCSGCFTSIANVFSMMGTVGVPITTIETRLESVPELGYDALADVPRGEICLRGMTLFNEYYKREDLTKDVFVNGWFHTGDIGELQPNGAMKIIDRKKNIFKLSQGEYVAVESLESIYSRCPLVTAIWVYGNSFESFLVGVVVPERKALEDWAIKNNETDDFKLLCENPKARKYVLDELNRTAKEHQLRGKPQKNLKQKSSVIFLENMATSADGRIALLSAASAQIQQGSLSLGGRGRRNVKFSNGQLMGEKLKSAKIKQRVCNNFAGHVYMSLTADVPGQAKLRDLEMEKRDPRTVVAIILGGGAGTRLFPLTKRRAKPAVPIGGAYRLIDVPMSNCINSGINKVYILTQFNSASLNRHLARAYNFGGSGGSFGDGYVEVLAATQTPGEAGKKWFQGTADAVRQFHWLFEDQRSKDIEDVLILSGDHLYRMDYMDFVQSHRQSGADITISSLPIDDKRASDFGLMKIDNTGRVLYFSEKPKGNELKAMAVDTTVLGLSRDEAEKKPYIASMGVYVFKKEILLNLLRWRFPTANDFGSEIIPASASEFNIKAYLFNDYWEDIGTIKSFFEANLTLTEHPSKFSFYDATKPIYTSRRNLPPSKIDNSKIVDSIISHGSFLNSTFIEHSVVGIRSRINSNVHLKDTVMLGADYYETDAEIASLLAEGRVPIGIGENSRIKGCIIDKNARIGKNVVIENSEGIQEADRSTEGFYIRSGITVVMKDSTIKDGLVI